MLAGTTSTIWTMLNAVGSSIHALDAAAEIDVDRSEEDRQFFTERKTKLQPLFQQLLANMRSQEDYDLGDNLRLQRRVEIGDEVLDRGISVGNAATKLALRGKPGLDHTHVYGQQVTTLTREKLAKEPEMVLRAVERFADLPDFPGKTQIAEDLAKRAQKQQVCLDDRDQGNAARDVLVGNGLKLIVDAAHALAALKGALDERFPKQRDYVAAFFLDVSPKKPSSASTTAPSPGGG